MKDPYETLGIQRDAPIEVIKRAFRAQSSAAHPDRNGGDGRKQQELNDAYAVLSDPERRRQFDETGTADNRQRDSMARDLIIMFVQEGLRDEGLFADPNPLKFARSKIEEARTNATLAKAKSEGLAERLKRRIKKLKRKDKGGDDFLLATARHMEENAGATVTKIARDIEGFDLALKLLEEWDWEEESIAGGAYNWAQLR